MLRRAFLLVGLSLVAGCVFGQLPHASDSLVVPSDSVVISHDSAGMPSDSLWNLAQCVDWALAHSFQIEGAVLARRSAEISRRSAWWSFSPHLSGGASLGYDFGRAIDYGSNAVSNDLRSMSFSVGASMSLFTGLARIWNLKATKAALCSAQAREELARQNVTIEVTNAYYNLLFQTEMVELLEQQQTLGEEQVELGRRRMAAGSITRGELLDLEASLAAETAELIEGENQLALARLSLMQTMNLVGPPIHLERPLGSGDSCALSEKDEELDLEFAAEGFDNYAQSVMSRHPARIQAEHDVSSAEYNLKASRAGYFPTVSIGASYGSGARSFLHDEGHLPTDPIGQQFRDNASQGISLSVNVPIFDGLNTRHQVLHQRVSLLNSKLQADEVQLELYKVLQSAWTDCLSAQRRYVAARTELEASRQAFDWAEHKLQVGAINTYDYSQAKLRFKQAETRALRARYEFNLKRTILDIYGGKAIELE